MVYVSPSVHLDTVVYMSVGLFVKCHMLKTCNHLIITFVWLWLIFLNLTLVVVALCMCIIISDTDFYAQVKGTYQLCMLNNYFDMLQENYGCGTSDVHIAWFIA